MTRIMPMSGRFQYIGGVGISLDMDLLVLILGYIAAFGAGYWLRSYISWRRRWGRTRQWGHS